MKKTCEEHRLGSETMGKDRNQTGIAFSMGICLLWMSNVLCFRSLLFIYADFRYCAAVLGFGYVHMMLLKLNLGYIYLI